METRSIAQFYGSMSGNRGEATRMGTKKSGFEAHIRGWNIGVRIWCRYDEETGKDEISVYRTGGSNGQTDDLIAELETADCFAKAAQPLPIQA